MAVSYGLNRAIHPGRPFKSHRPTTKMAHPRIDDAGIQLENPANHDFYDPLPPTIPIATPRGFLPWALSNTRLNAVADLRSRAVAGVQ